MFVKAQNTDFSNSVGGKCVADPTFQLSIYNWKSLTFIICSKLIFRITPSFVFAHTIQIYEVNAS